VHPPAVVGGGAIGSGAGGGGDAGGSQPPLEQMPPPSATNGSGVVQPEDGVERATIPTVTTTWLEKELLMPSFENASTTK
jgi:hypothetical protein